VDADLRVGCAELAQRPEKERIRPATNVGDRLSMQLCDLQSTVTACEAGFAGFGGFFTQRDHHTSARRCPWETKPAGNQSRGGSDS
jgi:hypothetical protein